MKAWLEHNLHSLGLAIRTLTITPLASLLSILVIGIALSLPAGLYLALVNLEHLAGGVQTRPDITLFIKTDLDEKRGRKIASQLGRKPGIASVQFVPKTEGLKRLQASGLSDITAGLDQNPLPDAIQLTVKQADAVSMERLNKELRAMPEIEQVLLDQDWAKRLSALLDFGRDLVLLLAGLLGLALAAITGNTIRLQIYATREEIEVSRLIGATDRFIRRPFLYFGAIQGLLGGLAGWSIVTGALWLLQDSLTRIALVWSNPFNLVGLGLLDSAVLLTSATLLGLLGASLAVSHSLAKLSRSTG